MKIKTRQFGEVDIDEEKIIIMPSGIPGFKDQKRYVVLQKEETIPFFLFQCVDDANLSFVVLDPVKILPEYTVEETDFKNSVDWIFEKEEISCFVIVTIPSGCPEKMTANLLAPLIINNKRKEGLQLILQTSTYSHQYPLLQ